MGNKKITTISRRKFVKRTSLGAGSLILAGTLPVERSAWVQGNETLKLALIGCGGRGTGAANHALLADKDVKLVAMADIFRDRLDTSYDSLSQRHDRTRLDVPEEHKFTGFDSYKRAIELADVVILATPPGFRPIHFEAAVNAGKHVFMEKPVATDSPGIRKVLQAGKRAQQNDLNVVVGLQRRYQTEYQEIARRIHQGQIGKIMSGQIFWNEENAWMRERLPEHTEMEYQLRNWFYFTWLSGDLPLEQHIHNIDVANWFIGEYPASAQGMGGREVRKGKEYGNIFDHNFVALTYPRGAVINSQCRHQPGTTTSVSEWFQGCEGTVQTGWGYTGTIRNSSGTATYEHDAQDDPNPYQQEHIELFKAIRKGDTINDTEIGAKSTLSAIMVRMASYSGKIITWEEAMNSQKSLMPEKFGFNETPPILPDENGYYPIAIPGVTEVL